VAVELQEGRLYAAWSRLPAVQEEDFHGHFDSIRRLLALAKSSSALDFSPFSW
jgi:hypothetical protein